MKRKIAILLTAVMVAGLTACGSGGNATGGASSGDNPAADSAEAPAQTGGEKQLAVEIGPDPETMDPALNSAIDGGNMQMHAFECLLLLDKDGKLLPGRLRNGRYPRTA